MKKKTQEQEEPQQQQQQQQNVKMTSPVKSFDSVTCYTDIELVQCVDDMYSACGSAISILNDLLLFDKMEDGELNLDKSEMGIGALFLRALSPFSPQVKA